MRLICHIKDDSDILEAWLQHYTGMGISSFHFIVHGTEEENATLLALRDHYPIAIEDWYEGIFFSKEKVRRINALLRRFERQWIVLVDSDEFLELPFRSLKRTVRFLQQTRTNMLWAPMVQRVSADGSLRKLNVSCNPCKELPLCSTDLYRKMGTQASTSKFPLFLCKGAELKRDGNHEPPLGARSSVSIIKGATHHFKWRYGVLDRIRSVIHSPHEWRHESETYLSYLSRHGFTLPTEDTFVYSRQAMFRRGLLIRFPPTWGNLTYMATNLREVLGMVHRRIVLRNSLNRSS